MFVTIVFQSTTFWMLIRRRQEKNKAFIVNDDYFIKHNLDFVVGIHSRKWIQSTNEKEYPLAPRKQYQIGPFDFRKI